jgi:hypothetical protein
MAGQSGSWHILMFVLTLINSHEPIRKKLSVMLMALCLDYNANQSIAYRQVWRLCNGLILSYFVFRFERFIT